jgi:hypothetical protein
MTRLLSAIRRGWIFWMQPCPKCVRVGRECPDCFNERQY